MVLRINLSSIDRESYLRMLEEATIEFNTFENVPSAVELFEARAVDTIPGFNEGLVSVQDASAQLATRLLEPELRLLEEGSWVLDACAAPGGKTCHLLESSAARVCAVDISEVRLQRVNENLQRLGFSARATCVSADAGSGNLHTLNADNQPYEIALLDAPCSGSGVMRRQPDIKLLRKAQDLGELAALQRKLADSVWSSIKPGGKLLYVTCSIFRQENDRVMRDFLETHADAETLDLAGRSGGLLQTPIDGESTPGPGAQVLTGAHGMDGFYYCLLHKTGSTDG